VRIEDGKIAEVIQAGRAIPGITVDDAGDGWVFPGLVDSHVHINEPGRTEWEGFVTATRAAAAGGITTLVDMPLNSDPVTTTSAALREKLAAAEGKLAVDVGFHAGLIPGNADQLEAIIAGGVCGVKAFMVYSGIPEFPAATKRDLEAAMPVLARHGIPLLAHAELDGPVVLPDGPGSSYRRYLASRPSSWEVDAIKLLIELSESTGAHVHVVHLATADALPLLASARARGVPVTVESCPHYLHFCAEQIPDGAPAYKCAPPIRERAHREALWDALDRGEMDMVVSDHSPCPPEMKDLKGGDYFKSWGGIASLQLGLPIIITECRRRDISYERIAEWMCAAPAKLAGLSQKGVIQPGADADLVIVNPEQSFTVNPEQLYHRHKVTPYAHETLYGVVQKTYLRGRAVFDSQNKLSDFHGEILRRC
jgi:allantoinase